MKKRDKDTHKEEPANAPAGEQPKSQVVEAQKSELEEMQQQIDALQKDKSGLQAEIDSLRKEKEDLFGRLQRLSADYANFQKRVPKQISDSLDYQKESIIRALLPVLDDFERTLHNAESNQDTQAIVNGVHIIYDHTLGILKSHGVEQVKAVGEKFDPARHEAVMLRCEPDKQNDIVLEELQKGYKVNGRVIRPSRVVVNKLEESPSPQQQPASEIETSEESEGEFESTDTQ